MLVLSRKDSERIRIGEDIIITVVGIKGDRVQLGIDAPRDLPVHRQEVYDDIKRSEEQTKREGYGRR